MTDDGQASREVIVRVPASPGLDYCRHRTPLIRDGEPWQGAPQTNLAAADGCGCGRPRLVVEFISRPYLTTHD